MSQASWIERVWKLPVIAVATLCSACQAPLAPLETAGPTMREILRQRVEPEQQIAGGYRETTVEFSQRAVTRESDERPTAFGEFRSLPNPVLLMWVHPHFVGGSGGVPVPGYMTAFPLYSRDHLALPWELRR